MHVPLLHAVVHAPGAQLRLQFELLHLMSHVEPAGQVTLQFELLQSMLQIAPGSHRKSHGAPLVTLLQRKSAVLGARPMAVQPVLLQWVAHVDDGPVQSHETPFPGALEGHSGNPVLGNGLVLDEHAIGVPSPNGRMPAVVLESVVIERASMEPSRHSP